MSNKKFRGNKQIAKARGELVDYEKRLGHRRLKLYALCTHNSAPAIPDVARRVMKDGKPQWVCRNCNQPIDLHRITDEELNGAVKTVNNACDLIKIVCDPSIEHDRKLIDIISGIQLNTNAYLKSAYDSALNAANRHEHPRNRSNSSGGFQWMK